MALNGATSMSPPAVPGGGQHNEAVPLVLVLGFPDSVHVARWLKTVGGRGIRFVILPVYDAALSREFGPSRLISGPSDLIQMPDHEVGVFDISSVPPEEIAQVQEELQYVPWKPDWLAHLKMTHPAHVAAAIRRLRPAVVHSLVVQFAGYLAFASRQYLKQEFPTWLLSNWGSDIFLYRKLQEHEAKIREILCMIDGYHAECDRDLRIATQMGFRRFAFPVIPASGGMDFSRFQPLHTFERPSSRREILIKGYHGWAGRALHILAAIHMTADVLRHYKIRINLAGQAVSETASAIAETDGLDIAIEPYLENHQDALLRLANARIVVGMGISDGISTTLLEAMAVGTFPIQGCNSCGNEWIEAGRTGFLVSPHDVGGLAKAIRRAVEDDSLVDAAAEPNRRVVENRWDSRINGEIAVRSYKILIESARKRLPDVELQTTANS